MRIISETVLGTRSSSVISFKILALKISFPCNINKNLTTLPLTITFPHFFASVRLYTPGVCHSYCPFLTVAHLYMYLFHAECGEHCERSINEPTFFEWLTRINRIDQIHWLFGRWHVFILVLFFVPNLIRIITISYKYKYGVCLHRPFHIIHYKLLKNCWRKFSFNINAKRMLV